MVDAMKNNSDGQVADIVTPNGTATIPSMKLLFNLEEAGAILGLSGWTIRDMVKAGIIRAAKVPHPFNKGKYLQRPILIHLDELVRVAAIFNAKTKEASE